MLPGINHNIRYADRSFHVQTEDRGVAHARIRTHVFLEGSVVAEDGADYADLADYAPRARAEEVRRRMQALHKSSMKRLVHGEFDAAIMRLAALPRDSGGVGAPKESEHTPADEYDVEIDDWDDDGDEEMAALLGLFDDGPSNRVTFAPPPPRPPDTFAPPPPTPSRASLDQWPTLPDARRVGIDQAVTEPGAPAPPKVQSDPTPQPDSTPTVRSERPAPEAATVVPEFDDETRPIPERVTRPMSVVIRSDDD